MSILRKLSSFSLFYTYDDILLVMKQFTDEKIAYLRLGKPSMKIQFWNKNSSSKKKIDEKYIYKEVAYHCLPLSKPLQHKGLRPEQNLMFCGCEALIHF